MISPMKHLRSCSALCAVALALTACTTPAPAQQAIKVDPDTGQLVEPTTLLIGAGQTLTASANATVALPVLTGPLSVSGNFTLSGFGEWNEGAIDLRNYSGGYYRLKAGDNYLSFTELDSAKENATDLGGFDYNNDYTQFKVGGQYPGRLSLWDIGYNNYTNIYPSDEGTLFIGPWELVTNAPGVRLSPPNRDGQLAINAVPVFGSLTAVPGLDYIACDTVTFTDPDASNSYYWVTVRSGNATIGGQTFPPGTRVHRINAYDIGTGSYVWTTYSYFSGVGGGSLTITPYSGSTTISPSQSGIGWADAGRFTVQTPVGALQFYYTGSPSEPVLYWPGRIVTTNFESISIVGSVNASLLSGGTITDSVIKPSLPSPLQQWQLGTEYAALNGLTYVTDTDLGFSQLEPTIGVWYPQVNVVNGGALGLNYEVGRYRSLTQYLSDLGRLTATASLDFPSIAAGAQATLTIALSGAVVNDSISLGLPAAPPSGLVIDAYVSAAATVTVRARNVTASAIDPAADTYRVTKF
jgi:hypothetical protein